MFEASLPVAAAWTNAAIFSAAGLINLFGFQMVRETYERWDIPARVYRTLGLVELVTAAFLLQPDLRMWGIALAAIIGFGAGVVLLQHRHYLYALGVMLMLAGLVPAMLAIPQSRVYVQYVV